MSFSDEDDDDVFLFWWHLRIKIRNKKRKYWINPAFKQLVKYGANVCAEFYPVRFKSCYRMSPDTFRKLFEVTELHAFLVTFLLL